MRVIFIAWLSFISISTFASTGFDRCTALLLKSNVEMQMRDFQDERNQAMMEDIATSVALRRSKEPIGIAIKGGPRSGKTHFVRELRAYFQSGSANRFAEFDIARRRKNNDPRIALFDNDPRFDRDARPRNLRELGNRIKAIDIYKPVPIEQEYQWIDALSSPIESSDNPAIYIFELDIPFPNSPVLLSRLKIYDLYDWASEIEFNSSNP